MPELHSTALQILCILMLHAMHCECSCMPGYSPAGSGSFICVSSEGPKGLTFCKSLDFCASKGHKLLTPSAYKLIKSSMTKVTWIAAHRCIAREKDKQNWLADCTWQFCDGQQCQVGEQPAQ
jgi:hypothetical protein